MKKKCRQSSPLKKCGTKWGNSEKKKLVQGTFTAVVNIEDVCDETTTMEDGSSWITLPEESKSENKDDVFESSSGKVPGKGQSPGEDNFSPPEIFRRSENNYDEWSLGHLFEDGESNANTEKGTVDIFLASESCASSDSNELENDLSTTRTIVPLISPLTSCIEQLNEFSPIPFSQENKQTQFEYNFETGKARKLPLTGSDRLRRILSSTKISVPRKVSDRLSSSSITELDFSSISCRTEQHEYDSGKESKFSEKKDSCSRINFVNISCPKIQRIEHSEKNQTVRKTKRGQRKKLFSSNNIEHDASKNSSLERLSIFAEESRILGSVTGTGNNFEALPEDKIQNICETPKFCGRLRMSVKRNSLPNERLRQKIRKEESLSQSKTRDHSKISPNKQDVLQKSPSGTLASTIIFEIPKDHGKFTESGENIVVPSSIFTENADKSDGKIFIEGGNQSKESSRFKLMGRSKNAHKREDKEDSLNKTCTLTSTSLMSTQGKISIDTVENPEAPVKTPKENASKTLQATYIQNGNQSKKPEATKLSKKEKNLVRKTEESSLKEKRQKTIASSIPTQDVTVPSEYEGSYKTHPSKISRNSRTKFIKVGSQSKNIESAKLRKKNLHVRKTDENSLKQKHLETIDYSVPVEVFIEPTEDEESFKTHSSRISRNSQTVLKDVNSKIRKKKTRLKNKKFLDVEEIISTPSKSTVTQSSIDYVVTSESEKREASSRHSQTSDEKFLQEYNLYESSTEVESTKVKKRTKNLKRKSKDSWEIKSLSEKLREYKEYLKTIPICDLSVQWRTKENKQKDSV